MGFSMHRQRTACCVGREGHCSSATFWEGCRRKCAGAWARTARWTVTFESDSTDRRFKQEGCDCNSDRQGKTACPAPIHRNLTARQAGLPPDSDPHDARHESNPGAGRSCSDNSLTSRIGRSRGSSLLERIIQCFCARAWICRPHASATT